jgi:signal transduction histidine kinase
MSTQIATATAGTAVIAIGGSWLGARAMFYSDHDLAALAVLLVAASTVGVVAAVLVGDRLARQTADLRATTRTIGNGGGSAPPTHAASAELAALERELQDTATRLEDARRRERAVDQSRRELVAWVSHDLRTPLGGIRAIAEALEDDIAADETTRRHYYATLRREAEQLGDLLDDLFELSRAQAGVLQLEIDRLSLGDLVSDAIAGIAPVAESKGVRLEGRVADDVTELRGSAPELLRALRNLLENAVRHTPADGSVVVEVGCRGDRAYVSVVDDGPGIADHVLPQLVDVGFRADPARTPGDGAGLGLAIARSLVEAHRGHITVQNEDRGARFTVWLPVDAAGRTDRPDPTPATT